MMARIDMETENGFVMAGYYLTLGITELNSAMRTAKLDADTVNDVNRKYDVVWKAYREAYENSEEGHE